MAVGLGISLLAPQPAPAADLNGDGRDDLAFGADQDEVAGVGGAGSAHVLHGSRGGLAVERNELLSQAKPWMRGEGAEIGDGFSAGGFAAGDFDRDGHDELVVGYPGSYRDRGQAGIAAGRVAIFRGTSRGIQKQSSGGLSPFAPALAGPAPDDSGWELGRGLAIGRFDEDRFDDLAIGVPGASEVLDGEWQPDVGGVYLLSGSKRGISASRSRYVTAGSDGMAGSGGGREDEFGWQLAAGDLDQRGHDDLVVSAPQDPDLGLVSRGKVYTLFEADPRRSRYLTAQSPGITGEDENPVGTFGVKLSRGERAPDECQAFARALLAG